MERPVNGNVVVLPFPFSDLSASKKRPAIVIAQLSGDDIILAQITTKEHFDEYAITLQHNDFKEGRLPQESMIRPNKLFTADKGIISYKAGSVTEKKMEEVEQMVIKIITK